MDDAKPDLYKSNEYFKNEKKEQDFLCIDRKGNEYFEKSLINKCFCCREKSDLSIINFILLIKLSECCGSKTFGLKSGSFLDDPKKNSPPSNLQTISSLIYPIRSESVSLVKRYNWYKSVPSYSSHICALANSLLNINPLIKILLRKILSKLQNEAVELKSFRKYLNL